LLPVDPTAVGPAGAVAPLPPPVVLVEEEEVGEEPVELDGAV
jgi:hypothetical protein